MIITKLKLRTQSTGVLNKPRTVVWCFRCPLGAGMVLKGTLRSLEGFAVDLSHRPNAPVVVREDQGEHLTAL